MFERLKIFFKPDDILYNSNPSFFMFDKGKLVFYPIFYNFNKKTCVSF